MKNTLLCIMLIISVVCNAQRQIYVRGYVLDEHNRGLEFVQIQVKGTTNGTITNEKGFYELSVDLNDSTIIVYSAAGYKTIEKKIPQTNDKSLNITITLPLLDATMLGEVAISAHQRQRDMMQRFNLSDFLRTPDASGGIEGIIKMSGSVAATNELSSQYSVRGGSYDENSVYVNGVEIYRPLLIRLGQQEGLSFINPDMVQSVMFSAGGFEAKYADKMSSVLDVTYKIPKTKFEASLSASLLGASAYVGSAGKKFTQTHGFRFKTNQYLLVDKLKLKNGKAIFKGLDTNGDYQNMFFDYQTFLTYQINPKWQVTFLGNISHNNYNFTPRSQNTEFGTFNIKRHYKVDFTGQEKDVFATYFGSFAVNYFPRKNLKLSLSASAFNTQESETYTIRGSYTLSDVKQDGDGNKELEELGSGSFTEHARNRLSASVATIAHLGEWKLKHSTMQWGVTGGQEIIFDKIREWERLDSAQYSLPHDGEKVRVNYNLFSENAMISTRLTSFFQWAYTTKFFNTQWIINAGARANYWSFNEEWLLSPRFSLSCFPQNQKLKDLSFRFAGGLYYQSPFYKELRQTEEDEYGNAEVILNRNIKAQRSWHFIMGTDYYFRLWRRPFKFTAEIYYKPAWNIISYNVDNVKVRYSGENDAVAYTCGVDLKLFGEFIPGVDSWITFSWMRSREDILGDSYEVIGNGGTNFGTVEPGYIPRPNEQRYSFTIFFQDYIPNHPEYRVNLKFVWADGFPHGPPRSERYMQTLRTEPYRRVDLGASRGFAVGREKFMSRQNVVKEFWLNLELLNLLNIKNVSSYYWITDIYGIQTAIPNRLTGFMVNFRVSVNF